MRLASREAYYPEVPPGSHRSDTINSSQRILSALEMGPMDVGGYQRQEAMSACLYGRLKLDPDPRDGDEGEEAGRLLDDSCERAPTA